ncbi:hypothetical protein FHX06_001136 [Rhizobium sp. BK512]|nr:hypothetical protein [Rhizobium sp. BK512]MBB3442345.1 hypothetical protein [Rhizobium sp. BK379]MBB3559839.1 hypothetical protein [Rhizobium sp. BK512]
MVNTIHGQRILTKKDMSRSVNDELLLAVAGKDIGATLLKT